MPRNVKFSPMRPKGYFIRNQDYLRRQRMNSKVPTIYYPTSKQNYLNDHSRFLVELFSKSCHSIVVDLPANARLDDLASLLQLDSQEYECRTTGHRLNQGAAKDQPEVLFQQNCGHPWGQDSSYAGRGSYNFAHSNANTI